jgi:hypothetical protein
MIISKLIGGLGNQMFQYAAGAALAQKKMCQFKIDISAFENYSLHNGYELDIFNITGELASKTEVQSLTGAHSKIGMMVRRKLQLNKKTHIIEKEFNYNKNFFDEKESAYLEGYWQSYRYPESCEKIIRNEFTFKSEPVGLNYDLAQNITNSNSVSVHIRRGDYITNPNFNGVHGFIGLDYYLKALQQIEDIIELPKFFVFSDDIDWVKNNLKLSENACYVSHNKGNRSYEDMRLMSMCKHNIIANSTFSWWAAWLNSNPKKVVIAPANWFANTSVVPNYEKFLCSLFPTDWTTI